MTHWTRRRNIANSTEAAAAEWAAGAPTSALVRIIAEDAAPATVRGAVHALDHGPASRFVAAAAAELDNRIPVPRGPHDVRE